MRSFCYIYQIQQRLAVLSGCGCEVLLQASRWSGRHPIELCFCEGQRIRGVCLLKSQDPAKREYSRGAGCLTRLYWMLAGNAALAISFGPLIGRHPKSPSLLDVACLFFRRRSCMSATSTSATARARTVQTVLPPRWMIGGGILCSSRLEASACGWRSAFLSP